MNRDLPGRLGRLCFLVLFLTIASISASGQDSQRPRIGLVLSGGGARGFAHIGVLKVLDSLNIPIDYIAGTSMGAVMGGLYAIGYSPHQLDSLARNIDWPVIFSDEPPRSKLTYLEKRDMDRFQLTLKINKLEIREPSALIFGQKISLLLTQLVTPEFEQVNFDTLPIAFQCVAADLITGNEVVLGQGSLPRAIRASMAVPSIFTPVEWGDSLLVDGGVLNNLPVDVVRKMGADYIIAVDVGTPLRSRQELSGAISILLQSFSLAGSNKEKENLKMASLTIRPDLQNFSATDFNRKKINLMIEKGRQSVYPHLDTLVKLSREYNVFAHSIPSPYFDKGILYGIQITGNRTLPFSFIYQNLGLKPGETFTSNLVENRINHLYSLGYFHTVNYSLEKMESDLYRIHVNVNERAGSFLRLGFRYQDDFKGILGINLKLKDFPFPGILNDISYLFSGLQLFEWELSYPRRAFGSRIYPYFLGFYQDIPIYIFYNGDKIASYRKRSYGGSAGLGMILFNWGEFRAEYMLEKLQVTPNIALTEIYDWPEWQYNVHMGRIYTTIDLLDNPLRPRHGYKAHFELNRTLNLIRQRENFSRFYTCQEFYGTIIPRNTSSINIFMGFSKNTQFYRYYYLNEPLTFIGYYNDEFSGSNLATYRFENRFHWTNIISLVGVFNIGHIWEDVNKVDFRDPLKTGYGIGFQVDTFLGPFRYLIGFSKEHTVQYFTFGFSLKTRTGSRQ